MMSMHSSARFACAVNHILISSQARNAEDYVGRDAVVSGWGGTVGYSPGQSVNQKGSSVLRETTLRVQPPNSGLCRKAYARDDYKLCAYR